MLKYVKQVGRVVPPCLINEPFSVFHNYGGPVDIEFLLITPWPHTRQPLNSAPPRRYRTFFWKSTTKNLQHDLLMMSWYTEKFDIGALSIYVLESALILTLKQKVKVKMIPYLNFLCNWTHLKDTSMLMTRAHVTRPRQSVSVVSSVKTSYVNTLWSDYAFEDIETSADPNNIYTSRQLFIAVNLKVG